MKYISQIITSLKVFVVEQLCLFILECGDFICFSNTI